MPTKPTQSLETFPNPELRRAYSIEFTCPEFTCLCPKTGQPDFATISIRYVPHRTCVELKSLKLYLWSFRNEGHFHEAVTNRIADDLVKARQINVDTQDKVVTLTGQVNSAEEETRALQIARGTDGVRDVIDQIDIAVPQASFPPPAPLEVPPAP